MLDGPYRALTSLRSYGYRRCYLDGSFVLDLETLP